jgi:uncharacterized protein (TIGR02678 family)
MMVPYFCHIIVYTIIQRQKSYRKKVPMSEFARDPLTENNLDVAWDEEVFELSTFENPSLIRHTAQDILLAHTALLDQVIVSQQTDKDAFRLVKAHIKILEQWHEQHTGWRIQRGSLFFRLERHLHMVIPVFVDDKLKEARDFACLAWILWFAEKRYLAGGGKHQQFLLSQLTEEIQLQTQAIDKRGLDIRNVQDRYSMRRSLEYLSDLGCLQVLEGEIKKWSDRNDQEQQEVLYEFTPLAHSLVEALNEKRVAELYRTQQKDPWPGPPQNLSSQAHDIPPLVRVWRSLLLGPALLRYDDAEAFLALTKHSEQVNEELAAMFGWSLELNRDYACIVRGGGVSIGSGAAINFNGAIDHILLLLCGKFRAQVQEQQWIPDSYGCISVTQWQILPLFNDLRQSYGTYWGATVQNTNAEKLLEEVYLRMRQTGLLRGPNAQGNILILPTAARYNVSYMALSDTDANPRARTRERKKKVLVKQQQTLFD